MKPEYIGPIDVGPALARLIAAYPEEEVQIKACLNEKHTFEDERRGLRFWAAIGDPLAQERVFKCGDTPIAAAESAILAAGPRDRRAMLQAKIEEAQANADAARAELLKLQIEQKLIEEPVENATI